MAQVMKSIMPLISPAAGYLSHVISIGSSFASGDLIGTLELQDPDAVPTLEPFIGGFPTLAEPSTQAADPFEDFQGAMRSAEMVMTGTALACGKLIRKLVQHIAHGCTAPTLT